LKNFQNKKALHRIQRNKTLKEALPRIQRNKTLRLSPVLSGEKHLTTAK